MGLFRRTDRLSELVICGETVKTPRGLVATSSGASEFYSWFLDRLSVNRVLSECFQAPAAAVGYTLKWPERSKVYLFVATFTNKKREGSRVTRAALQANFAVLFSVSSQIFNDLEGGGG